MLRSRHRLVQGFPREKNSIDYEPLSCIENAPQNSMLSIAALSGDYRQILSGIVSAPTAS